MMSNEVAVAEARAIESARKLDRSIDELIDKIEGTTESVSKTIETVNAPFKTVKNLAIRLREGHGEDSVPFLLAVGVTAACVLGLGLYWRSQNFASTETTELNK